MKNELSLPTECNSGSALPQVLSRIADGYCIFDANGLLRLWSDSVCSLYPGLAEHITTDLTYRELLKILFSGSSVRNFTPATDIESWLTSQIQRLKDNPSLEFVHHLHNGKWLVIKYVLLDSGESLFACFDITELRQEKVALRNSEDKFKRFARLASNWFWELDENLNYLYHSTHEQPLAGVDAESLVGKPRIGGLNGMVVNNNQLTQHNECLLAHKDVDVVLSWNRDNGKTTYSHILAQPRFDENNRFCGYIGCGRDVTNSQELQKQLEHEATHDHLTGLLNRHAFEERLDQLLLTLKQANGVKNRHYTVAAIDLDQFKLVNDAAGHVAGDQLLMDVSNILKSACGDCASIARLVGDEFGVCLELDSAKSVDLMNEIVEQIHRHQFIWKNRKFTIGASAGTTQITEQCKDTSSILNRAEAACHSAKQLGRNQVQQFSPSNDFQAHQNEELRRVRLLKSAMDNDRLLIFAQRIVPTRPSSIQKFEVLLRVLDEDLEHAPIHELIPVAEKYDLMQHVDLWILNKAIDYIPSFHELGIEICLSVNLSGNTLSNEACLAEIESLVENMPFNSECICLEITETAAIESVDNVIAFIDRMHELGVQFSLDDFGSGLSSYSYMKSLKVDYLKIDGSFVKEILDDAGSLAIVKSINILSHEMGMQTVAEFVENEDIADALTELEVDYLQGYALGRPEDVRDVLLSYKQGIVKTGT